MPDWPSIVKGVKNSDLVSYGVVDNNMTIDKEERRFRPGFTGLSGIFIYLLRVLRYFQHCTGHITTGSWKGRGNQYIQFVRVLYCKLPTDGKQLPAFPLEAVPGIEPPPQRWEERVLPLCHLGPFSFFQEMKQFYESTEPSKNQSHS